MIVEIKFDPTDAVDMKMLKIVYDAFGYKPNNFSTKTDEKFGIIRYNDDEGRPIIKQNDNDKGMYHV